MQVDALAQDARKDARPSLVSDHEAAGRVAELAFLGQDLIQELDGLFQLLADEVGCAGDDPFGVVIDGGGLGVVGKKGVLPGGWRGGAALLAGRGPA